NPMTDATNLKDIFFFDESILEKDLLILEGKKRESKQKIYERSKMLREQAIRYYSHSGKISCAACGFDFAAIYGEHGAGYIEIHHARPIFSYGEDDSQKTLEEALENVIPLCSNCH